MTTLRVALGWAVARLRKGQGYSQETFALRCKIARTYMTGIESGRHNVSVDMLERIAKGLKTDVGQLMTEAEGERRAPAPRS
jgi:transcriptional regulator with XRE-family HTH domain